MGAKNENTKKLVYTEGSGNIYQDMDFSDSEERLAKAQLAMRIEKIIDKRKLTQAAAAKLLKVTQPKISDLVNGRLSGYSMERLIHFLTLLNQDVEIVIKSKRGHQKLGHLKVAFG